MDSKTSSTIENTNTITIKSKQSNLRLNDAMYYQILLYSVYSHRKKYCSRKSPPPTPTPTSHLTVKPRIKPRKTDSMKVREN